LAASAAEALRREEGSSSVAGDGAEDEAAAAGATRRGRRGRPAAALVSDRRRGGGCCGWWGRGAEAATAAAADEAAERAAISLCLSLSLICLWSLAPVGCDCFFLRSEGGGGVRVLASGGGGGGVVGVVGVGDGSMLLRAPSGRERLQARALCSELAGRRGRAPLESPPGERARVCRSGRKSDVSCEAPSLCLSPSDRSSVDAQNATYVVL
jgi:hypothetical protein